MREEMVGLGADSALDRPNDEKEGSSIVKGETSHSSGPLGCFGLDLSLSFLCFSCFILPSSSPN